MLHILDDFRHTLDTAMIDAIHKRVVLYGWGYTGRFLKWYAEYYHSIKVDFIISTDMRGSQSYEEEIFRPTLLQFGYKDAQGAVLWLAEPLDDKLEAELKAEGYEKGKHLVEFYGLIYGDDVTWPDNESKDVYTRHKTGKRDIQFLEWLEWKYGCNFVTAIESSNFKVAKEHGASFRGFSQKEIFPILDHCHVVPTPDDAIFDFGCGKGGALVSFLDYAFVHGGGIEYEPGTYRVLVDNVKKLGLDDRLQLIQGDAASLTTELDAYNWFYFFDPFDMTIYSKCIEAICDSVKREERKVHVIAINPHFHEMIEGTGVLRLVNQFTIATRQRVVNIYENV